MTNIITEKIRKILDELGYCYDNDCLNHIAEKLKDSKTIEDNAVENEWLYYSRMNWDTPLGLN